jgi:hypothetical protein
MLAVAELYCKWADRSSSWTDVGPVVSSVFWVFGHRRRKPPSTEVDAEDRHHYCSTFYPPGQLGYNHGGDSYNAWRIYMIPLRKTKSRISTFSLDPTT